MDRKRFEDGLAVRRAVLGDAYVDQALAEADELSRPLQELVTEYCWGAVWTRPGLARKTRSLINVAMLTALNRPHEVRLHLRGALQNGCTKEEITEVLLQAAIYCGVPAANAESTCAGVKSCRLATNLSCSFSHLSCDRSGHMASATVAESSSVRPAAMAWPNSV